MIIASPSVRVFLRVALRAIRGIHVNPPANTRRREAREGHNQSSGLEDSRVVSSPPNEQ